MSWPYAHTPFLWPMLVSAVFLCSLALYAWRRRTTPGAIPFVLLMLGMAAANLMSAAEVTAADLPTKTFWFLAIDASYGATVLFPLCFALQYAGHSKWLTPRWLAPFVLVGVTNALLDFTNDYHYLRWSRIWYAGSMRGDPGPLGGLLTVYGMFMLLLTTAIFVFLFIRSPLHRWPVGLIVLGQLAFRLAYPLQLFGLATAPPLNLGILSFNFTALAYALALFRFRLFSVLPMARASVIEGMVDGLVVLDAENRVADLNAAAQVALALPARETIGRPARQALAAFPKLSRLLDDDGPARIEMNVDRGGPPRCFAVQATPLMHSSGFRLGRLISLQDVTEQKLTRERLVQQERMLAMMQERERLARELHDGLGQMLAAAHLQASTAKRLLAQGAGVQTNECLEQLAEMTLAAEADVREYLLGAQTAVSTERPFFAALRQYCALFQERHHLAIELTVPRELEEEGLAPAVEGQLLRIIQEALSNVRKHACAHRARVRFEVAGPEARIVIADDGRGFDPPAAGAAPAQGFGLQSMRGRAQAVGGRLAVISGPDQGTQIVVHVPLKE